MGKTRHADSPRIEQIQKEVLMEEGLFKQLSEPIPFRGNILQQEWDSIELEKLRKEKEENEGI